MPDIPLVIISVVYFAFSTITQTGQGAAESMQAAMSLYHAMYFTNPFVIAAHNLFHAPFLIALYALIGWWGMRRNKRWGVLVLWFALGCAFHSGVDILTHYDDGPLIYFPFNWYFRFTAPVSYWDPLHGGNVFRIFERALDVGIIAYFAANWLRNRARWRKQRLERMSDAHARYTSQGKVIGRHDELE